MGVMSGADADGLDQLGHHMQGAADRLEAIRGEVTAALNRTHWEGGDADQFRGQWNYRLSGLLHTAVTASREASTTLHRNADEQRRASGDDGGPRGGLLGGASGSTGGSGSSFFDLKDLLGLGLTTAGGVSLIADLLTEAGKGGRYAYRGTPDIKRLVRQPWAKALTHEKLLFNISDRAKGLAGAVHQLDKAGPLAVAGTVFDGADFVSNLVSNPQDGQTYHAGVDTIFDLAEIGTVECPPLSIGIGVVHLGYDALEAWHPGITKDAFEWTANAAVDLGTTAVNTVVDTEQTVVSAAGNVMSGGVHAVRNFFHW